jgi:hypothetical protein
VVVAAIAIFTLSSAAAQSPGPSPDPAQMPTSTPMPPAMMESRAAQHFPQSVRVGDLVGRPLLQPLESQPILGHVTGVVRSAGSGVDVVVRLDGGPIRPWLHWLGVGNRRVLVPVAGVALLGEFVALIGYTPEQLNALPDLTEGTAGAVDADEAIRVALVGPFH